MIGLTSSAAALAQGPEWRIRYSCAPWDKDNLAAKDVKILVLTEKEPPLGGPKGITEAYKSGIDSCSRDSSARHDKIKISLNEPADDSKLIQDLSAESARRSRGDRTQITGLICKPVVSEDETIRYD